MIFRISGFKGKLVVYILLDDGAGTVAVFSYVFWTTLLTYMWNLRRLEIRIQNHYIMFNGGHHYLKILSILGFR